MTSQRCCGLSSLRTASRVGRLSLWPKPSAYTLFLLLLVSVLPDGSSNKLEQMLLPPHSRITIRVFPAGRTAVTSRCWDSCPKRPWYALEKKLLSLLRTPSMSAPYLMRPGTAIWDRVQLGPTSVESEKCLATPDPNATIF